MFFIALWTRLHHHDIILTSPWHHSDINMTSSPGSSRPGRMTSSKMTPLCVQRLYWRRYMGSVRRRPISVAFLLRSGNSSSGVTLLRWNRVMGSGGTRPWGGGGQLEDLQFYAENGALNIYLQDRAVPRLLGINNWSWRKKNRNVNEVAEILKTETNFKC